MNSAQIITVQVHLLWHNLLANCSILYLRDSQLLDKAIIKILTGNKTSYKQQTLTIIEPWGPGPDALLDRVCLWFRRGYAGSVCSHWGDGSTTGVLLMLTY